MDLDHWSETRGVLDAEGWGWGGKRRHVRGRRMFYGFNLSRALRRDRFDPLIFFYFRWSFFFFTEPRCGIARNRKRRAGSRLDDR